MKEDVLNYLKEALNINASISILEKTDNIPVYLKGKYDFFTIKLFDREYLLAFSRTENFTPAEITAHTVQLKNIAGREVIFVFDTMAAFNRNRLIQKKVQFIVPKKQMYMPDLMIDLREHFKAPDKEKQTLTPAAQAVLFYHLLKGGVDRLSAGELSVKLSYTLMSISNSFRQLKKMDVCGIETAGKRNLIVFSKSGRELWDAALPFLINPVIKKLSIGHNNFTDNKNSFFASGLTALSHYTMISGGAADTYAIDHKHYNELGVRGKLQGYQTGEMEIEIEVWRYNPDILADGGFVDPLSLYMALKDTEDEREKHALDQMLRNLKW